MVSKRLFDCFIFFNELDLLDLRLEESFEAVDYFVVCEASRTFRGATKELVFSQNKVSAVSTPRTGGWSVQLEHSRTRCGIQ